MQISNRGTILREIAKVEKQLASLKAQQAQAEATLNALNAQLAKTANQSASRPSSSPAPALSPEQKIALFSGRFRCRGDVYPKLWQNQKTGKKGYSPACTNEWVRGVCEKPRVKCGECPSQAFMSVSPDVIPGHLQGRHVIGVYPMLTDETCWFLAADFDKFQSQGSRYLLDYTRENRVRLIYLEAVGPHEHFYRNLRR